MPVFNRDEYNLFKCVNALAERMVSHLPQPFTAEDALSLYPVEWRDMAREAPRFFSCAYRDTSVRVQLPKGRMIRRVALQYLIDDAPMVPKKPFDLNEIDPKIRNKLLEWVNLREEIAIQFGTVNVILKELNHTCTNINQFAFYMPTISLVMGVQPETFESKLAVLKQGASPKTIPAISPWARKHLEAASGILAAAIIMPEESINLKSNVSIEVSQWGDFEVDGKSIHPV